MNGSEQKELQRSIDELVAYHDRLEREIKNISHKLQMPQKKVVSILKEHAELKTIKEVLSKLKNQLRSEESD